MNVRAFIAVIALSAGTLAGAAPVKKVYRAEQRFEFAAGGLFVIENPFGNVTVRGTDGQQIETTIAKTVTGKDDAAVDEGRNQSAVIVGGDAKTRLVRAAVPLKPRPDWGASIDWDVRVPRDANVRVITQSSRRISISGVRGQVHIKNFSGYIQLEETPGLVVVETVNGSILYRTARPQANVVLRSVNGSVTAAVAPDADVRWIAETIKGDVRTNLPARGAFFGPAFRGSVNAPGGPTITTATLIGHVQLIAITGSLRTLQSLRTTPAILPAVAGRGEKAMKEVVSGFFEYSTNLGDVRVQEIRGDADIFTGAGEVQLGAVSGNCRVRSEGGPLQIGEVLGRLTAMTRAGDVLVDSVRKGGTIRTQGGKIQLLYSTGATSLFSGGGDISVRQAAGAISATTRSGDISITVDPSHRSERVSANTDQGNVHVNVSPQFAADVDITLITDNPDIDGIHSDFPGLSMSTDEYQGKTRIRATGKINGGGDRLELKATGGDIRLSTRPIRPTVVTTGR